MKKVLFVTSTLNIGGAQKVVSNLVCNLNDDFDVDILLNNDKEVVYPYRGRLISLNIKPKENKRSLLYQIKVFFKRYKKLKELKSEGNYEACISFLDSANIANIFSGKKTKVILSVNSSLKNAKSSLYYKLLVNPMVRFLYNKADKVVAVSRGIGNELSEYFGIKKEKIEVIENGVDLANVRKKAEEKTTKKFNELINNKKVIVTSGRLDDSKGQWHLIRAFNELSKKRDNVLLLILGKGPLLKYLKSIVQGYKIEDKVIFIGFRENPFSIISKADVFVMSSLWEGFPLALSEAICLGLPCIATRFETGSRELLEPDYGILTPLCSGKKYDYSTPLEQAEIELASAMEKMLFDNDVHDYYLKKSLERAKTLDIKYSVEMWEKLF